MHLLQGKILNTGDASQMRLNTLRFGQMHLLKWKRSQFDSKLNFVHTGLIVNKSALVDVMAWRIKGDKLLCVWTSSELDAQLRNSTALITLGKYIALYSANFRNNIYWLQESHLRKRTQSYISREVWVLFLLLLCSLMMCTNNRVHYGPMAVFICLHITHYHHYADVSEGIELVKCL